MRSCSLVIVSLSVVRNNSDYDDFYVVSKKLVTQQIKNAEFLIGEFKEYSRRGGVSAQSPDCRTHCEYNGR